MLFWHRKLPSNWLYLPRWTHSCYEERDPEYHTEQQETWTYPVAHLRIPSAAWRPHQWNRANRKDILCQCCRPIWLPLDRHVWLEWERLKAIITSEKRASYYGWPWSWRCVSHLVQLQYQWCLACYREDEKLLVFEGKGSRKWPIVLGFEATLIIKADIRW